MVSTTLLGEELGLPGCVEEAVEIARLVQHPDIERGRRLPFGEKQAWARIVFKHFTVPFDALQEHRRDREGDPRRIEPAAGQHVVDEPAVYPAVAVLERMNEDEPEGDRRRRSDRIDAALLALVRIRDQPADQAGNILGARADKIGNGAFVSRSRLPTNPPSVRQPMWVKRASPMTMRCRCRNSSRLSGRRPASPMA